MIFRSLFMRPAAFMPLVMSLVALGIVLVHIAVYGATREVDEGTAAHLWQLLMAAQLPIAAVFAFSWPPRERHKALLILAVQVAAMLAAIAPVYLLTL
jgi:hypothetical protein